MFDLTFIIFILSSIPVFFVFWIAGRFKNELVTDSSFGLRGDDNLSCLRGLAAVMVALHHSVYMFNYLYHDKWSIFLNDGFTAKSSNNSLLAIAYFGSIPVMIFFMITGFLFFRKIINKPINNAAIFLSARVKRLIPMYAFMVLCVVCVSELIRPNDSIGIHNIIVEVGRYFTFGIIDPNGLTPSIHGSLIVGGVIWTLAYEWGFYIILPYISMFVKSIRDACFSVIIMLFSVLIAYRQGLISEMFATLLFCFIGGFVAALASGYLKNNAIKQANSVMMTIVYLLSLIAVAYWQDFNIYNVYIVIPLFLFFLSACTGSKAFQIINTKFFKVAGSVSYSIYLMHGLSMVMTFNFISSSLNYTAFAAISLSICAMISCLTYLYIEKPAMKKNSLKTIS